MLTIAHIRRLRAKLKERADKEERKERGVAYIIDQFTRPEEVALMRRVYDEQFVQLSIHARKGARVLQLKQRIRDSRIDTATKDFSAEAEELIRRDHDEETEVHGQRLREPFHLADVIIDATDREQAKIEIERFVKLLFGNNLKTPSHDEYGMYLAKSASLRSADLSRQVGAAILSETGEVIALGSNEVPKPGGGTYFEGDKPDHRDFAEGVDYNE
jgi:cytidine deaminase